MSRGVALWLSLFLSFFVAAVPILDGDRHASSRSAYFVADAERGQTPEQQTAISPADVAGSSVLRADCSDDTSDCAFCAFQAQAAAPLTQIVLPDFVPAVSPLPSVFVDSVGVPVRDFLALYQSRAPPAA